jgi:hypothetical protein
LVRAADLLFSGGVRLVLADAFSGVVFATGDFLALLTFSDLTVISPVILHSEPWVRTDGGRRGAAQKI